MYGLIRIDVLPISIEFIEAQLYLWSHNELKEKCKVALMHLRHDLYIALELLFYCFIDYFIF